MINDHAVKELGNIPVANTETAVVNAETADEHITAGETTQVTAENKKPQMYTPRSPTAKPKPPRMSPKLLGKVHETKEINFRDIVSTPVHLKLL